MSVTRYFVTLSADGIPDVVALLDSDPAFITGGHGGWTVVPRERKVSLTQWQGKDPLRMDLSLLFDGVRIKKDRETEIFNLSRMALPPAAGGEPPVVTVTGDAFPDYGPGQWVIESLSWGKNVVWDYNNARALSRLRQDVIVHLMEYRADDRVAFSALASSGGITTGKSKSGWPKTYIVKRGDSLTKIAVTFYKVAAKWKQIATANGIRDPKSIKVGQSLRIPAP